LTVVTWNWGTNTGYDTGVSVADGKWHQVVLTYQSGVASGSVLYVDEHQVGSPTTVTVANQSNDALIGSGSTGGVEYFNGSIDDVAFGPTALTAAQVAAEYTAAW
jgi:Concanavalin A-like lectin/glucanases superfamily